MGGPRTAYSCSPSARASPGTADRGMGGVEVDPERDVGRQRRRLGRGPVAGDLDRPAHAPVIRAAPAGAIEDVTARLLEGQGDGDRFPRSEFGSRPAAGAAGE